jgi:hypothetical protein
VAADFGPAAHNGPQNGQTQVKKYTLYAKIKLVHIR